MPVTLANWAMAVAASSAAMSVEFPRSIIVRVKDSRLSLVIPNCPAFSMTPAMSVVEVAISVLMRLMESERCSYSASVASTVFRTPVKALSKSMAALKDAVPSARIGVVKTRDMVLPVFSAAWATAAQRVLNACKDSLACVHADRSRANRSVVD